METMLATVLREAGPYVALIGFFIWRDYKREQASSKVIDELQTFQRETLLKLLQRTTEVVVACTDAMRACVTKSGSK